MLKSYQGQIQNKSFSICDFILIFILNHWSGPRFAYLLMATSPSRLFIKVHLNNLSPVTTGVPRARCVMCWLLVRPNPCPRPSPSPPLLTNFNCSLSSNFLAILVSTPWIWRKRRKDLEYDIDEHWRTCLASCWCIKLLKHVRNIIQYLSARSLESWGSRSQDHTGLTGGGHSHGLVRHRAGEGAGWSILTPGVTSQNISLRFSISFRAKHWKLDHSRQFHWVLIKTRIVEICRNYQIRNVSKQLNDDNSSENSLEMALYSWQSNALF